MSIIAEIEKFNERIGQDQMQEERENALATALDKFELRQREAKERELNMRLAAVHRYTA